MSVLSGIGQIPPIFGAGGGTNALVYSYPIPATINITTPATTTLTTYNADAGTYLVNFGLSLNATDATTNVDTFRVAVSGNGFITQEDVLYNQLMLENVVCFTNSTLTFELTVPTTLTFSFQANTSGQTGLFSIYSTSQLNGSEGIEVYQLLA